ncbi:anthranilate synthase component II [Halarsenatibacter silvermanii]|uniref:Anthranilate synthase component 2 n=1 Tax=Halarsenatibacter silvermanii TaxID=321763 RepID=A0A1G9J693_9FIRM|nr:aminodeoxychorismate/anthranilate synthase component II [Halarsenatibacter silvermanii]SDL32756.1 anthranilate synthase component 2 [Halarsenatibacter silvermanii]
MVLVIDNYDSFTYNLVQYLGEMNEVRVVRNDRMTVEEVAEFKPDQIVISPGPGRPEDAGISPGVVEHCSGSIPILGVCLGHQCIGSVFGGRVVRSSEVYHGKTSEVYFTEKEDERFLTGIDSPFHATRYHSLTLERSSLPAELNILAETDSGEVMAISHRKFPVYGVQFHPESILTEFGRLLLENFLSIRAE